MTKEQGLVVKTTEEITMLWATCNNYNKKEWVLKESLKKRLNRFCNKCIPKLFLKEALEQGGKE